MEIKDSIYGPTNVLRGYGKINDMEYQSAPRFENNPAWFKFKINKDTLLTFCIVPENYEDDYDFDLFLSKGENFCWEVRMGHINPLRSCYSQNYEGKSYTGLSKYVEGNYVGPGPGPAYVKAIYVKKGELYYLHIDLSNNYQKGGSGFTLYFYGLEPPEPQPVVLKNVLFESNKSTFLPVSFKELDKLCAALKENKKMKILIIGHTDNVGKEDTNQKLSKERAKAVNDYLVKKGIDQNRLSYKGFGSQHPKVQNNTKEGQSENRRVEFMKVK